MGHQQLLDVRRQVRKRHLLALCHRQVGIVQQMAPLAPGFQIAELVAAQDQDQRCILSVLPAQRTQCVDGVAGALAVQLLLVDQPVTSPGVGGQGGNGQPQHGQPMARLGLVAAFLPGMASGDQHHLVELQGRHGGLSQGQMGHVNRVETATQQSDATSPAEIHVGTVPSQSRAGRKSV